VLLSYGRNPSKVVASRRTRANRKISSNGILQLVNNYAISKTALVI
jgi:hypothetical protein